MKRRNVLAAAALAFCLAFALTGCSKDSIINGFNDFLHHASRYALTDEKDLAGERTAGADTYTGTYTAEYDGFSGTEYLFGGTGLERESGNELTVTYELKVDRRHRTAPNRRRRGQRHIHAFRGQSGLLHRHRGRVPARRACAHRRVTPAAPLQAAESLHFTPALLSFSRVFRFSK